MISVASLVLQRFLNMNNFVGKKNCFKDYCTYLSDSKQKLVERNTKWALKENYLQSSQFITFVQFVQLRHKLVPNVLLIMHSAHWKKNTDALVNIYFGLSLFQPSHIAHSYLACIWTRYYVKSNKPVLEKEYFAKLLRFLTKCSPRNINIICFLVLTMAVNQSQMEHRLCKHSHVGFWVCVWLFWPIHIMSVHLAVCRVCCQTD